MFMHAGLKHIGYGFNCGEKNKIKDKVQNAENVSGKI
jgi:hypothetical protein